MANNFNHCKIKINLAELKGAALGNCNLGDDEMHRCIILPLDESCLNEDPEGVWLECAAIRIQGNPFEQTHIIKQQLRKDILDRMTIAEKRALPVLGGVQPFNQRKDYIAPEVKEVAIVLENVIW